MANHSPERRILTEATATDLLPKFKDTLGAPIDASRVTFTINTTTGAITAVTVAPA